MIDLGRRFAKVRLQIITLYLVQHVQLVQAREWHAQMCWTAE